MQPRAGAAHFALPGEDAEHRELERHIEIRIGEDDVRALAAEFERDLFDVPGRRAHDLAPRGGAAGEGDLSTSMLAASALPTTGPGPSSSCAAPGGKPASAINSKSRIAVIGVASAGLRMQQFPAARPGASFHAAISSG